MSDPLAGVAATFSKSPRFWSTDPAWEPKTIEFGRGAHVTGSDGREYLDWVSGLGAILLGYPDERREVEAKLWSDLTAANHWARYVAKQVWWGAGFSLPHSLERSVAERLTALLQAHVPGWQDQPLGLRWLKTGSDACAAAVRLARAVTGRSPILSIGYHGYHDWAVSATPPAWGVTEPQYVQAVPFGDPFGDLRVLGSALYEVPELPAAVIIEQPPAVVSRDYWADVESLCRRNGMLLIVDEVVTGLRYALGGACEHMDVTPDIICMGKALGNGLPISAIVGRREYWEWFSRDDPVFVSSTHFGDAVSLAAADAVLHVWSQAGVDHVWSIGRALMDGLTRAGYTVVGYPPVSLIQHDSPSHRAFFIREMARRGVLINRPNIPNLAHTLEDVDATVQAAIDVRYAMGRIDVEAEMQGGLPAVLFANR